MNFRLCILVFAFLLASALGRASDNTRWTKEFLHKLAENSYDKNIAPDGFEGPGSPVKVTVSAFILDIHSVDDSNMDFNAHMYFRQGWNDSRLKHSMNADFLILHDVKNIWTPDLFFVEEREGSLHQIMTPNTFCRIKPDGEVLFSSRVSVTFSCPMDLRNYPHDVQKCQMSIESYGFQRKHMDLEWLQGGHAPVMISEDIKLLEFDVVGVTPSEIHVSFATGNYSRLLIDLTLKRKFGFFATRLYVPFIILVLMTTLSLWIRAEERCLRLALLLVILYLMVTLSTSMNLSTPSAPYTKASDVWIAFCESLVFAAFLEFVVVAVIAGKESDEDGVKTKGEILLSLDPEAKDENKIKSPLSKVINMFDARRGGKRNSLSLRIDKTCRAVFPIIFVIFNIIYWSVYCSS